MTSQLPPWWSKVIPTEKIHLGLDLQGGMYLLLEVEEDKAVESYVEQIKNNLKDDLKEQGIPVGKLEREKDANRSRILRSQRKGGQSPEPAVSHAP